MDSITVICWTSPIVILEVSSLLVAFSIFDEKNCLVCIAAQADKYFLSPHGLKFPFHATSFCARLCISLTIQTNTFSVIMKSLSLILLLSVVSLSSIRMK